MREIQHMTANSILWFVTGIVAAIVYGILRFFDLVRALNELEWFGVLIFWLLVFGFVGIEELIGQLWERLCEIQDSLDLLTEHQEASDQPEL